MSTLARQGFALTPFELNTNPITKRRRPPSDKADHQFAAKAAFFGVVYEPTYYFSLLLRPM